MGPRAPTYLVNMLIALLPDLAICWAVARLTDSGWKGFFLSLFALQVTYLFFWLKNAAWAWLLFWTHGRKKVAKCLEHWFIESHFPAPDRYTIDFDDYLTEISSNKGLDAEMRIKAAHELGALDGFKGARSYSLLLMSNSAGKIAMKHYASLANRFSQ